MAYWKIQFEIRQYLVNLLHRWLVGSVCNWGGAHCDKPLEHLRRRLLHALCLFEVTGGFSPIWPNQEFCSSNFVVMLNSCFFQKIFCLDCTVYPVFFVLLRFLNDETSKPELLVTPKLARPGQVGIGFWNRSLVSMYCAGRLLNGKSQKAHQKIWRRPPPEKRVQSGHCLNFSQPSKDT